MSGRTLPLSPVPMTGYVILMDSSGTVRARAHGKAPDEQSIAVLKDALAKISTHPR